MTAEPLVKKKRPPLFGCEVPRLFTPPLRELTPDTSLGFEVIEFADEVLHVELFPWQKWLLIHALELLPNGSLRFRYIVTLVARQNGKSTLSQVLALYWLFVCGTPTVLGTAQDLDSAEDVWEGTWSIIEDTPDLLDLALQPIRMNGKKAIVLKSGERYKVKAANRRSARGLTGDRIILDELREHQTWDAWGAITKTTRARPDAQVWCFSNAGDITSVVLKYLRMKAHEALGDPDGIVAKAKILAPQPEDLGVPDELEDDMEEFVEDDDRDVSAEDMAVEATDLFIAEWSAAPNCSKWDRAGWAQSNPSLGWGALTERTMRSECGTDPEWVFRTEALCQWPEAGLTGPFFPGSWDSTLNQVVETPYGPQLARSDWITGPVIACVAVAADRSRAHIAIGGRRDDGIPQVEIHASRPGVEWIGPWLKARRDRIVGVTGQSRGSQVSPILADLAADPDFPIPVLPWQDSGLVAAWGEAYDRVKEGRVRHNPQMMLDMAAAAAVTKPLAGGKVIDLFASPIDAAPLEAFIGCLWAVSRPTPEPTPPAPPEAVKAIPVKGAVNLATVEF